jgi:bacterioferritin-associated ferredoxin
MYVCICNGITEEMLETASKQGHSDREILNRLGVGNSCGVCVIEALDSMRAKTKAGQTQQKHSDSKKISNS